MASPEPTPIRRPDLRCVLVEDQTLFLELLSQVLQLQPGLKIVARAQTVAEGLAACKIHKPDLLILDLELPDGEGLEVARSLMRWNPDGKVIVLSGHASTFFCPARIGKSILAVVDKTQTFGDLRAELTRLLPPLAAGNPVEKSSVKNPLFQKDLSEREAQIFGLIGEGLCSKEIATHLCLSEHTIQSHRKRIAAKLGTQGNELLQLTENFPVGAYVFYRDPQDNGPRFSFFSNRLLEMMDITREEIDADPMVAYRNLHPEDIGPFFEAAEEAARVKSHFFNESRYIIRGATRWYRLESVARQLPDGLTVWDGAVIDVTERRQAEDEAKTALHLTENIPVGTYALLSPHQGPQRYTFLSKRWLEMTGLDPVKLKEDISHYFSIVHPEDREEAIAHNIAGAAALKPYKWEGRWLREGKVTWVSIESVPRKTATGEVVWEGVFIDITARKEAEAQLLAAKEEFYRIINHLPIPVASTLHTPGLPVNFINKAFTETYGWTIEDCPTMADWARCAYPDEKYRKAVFDEFDAEVAQSVRENRPARPMEFLVTCKHGGQRNVRIDCLVAENMLFGTFLDITEQRQAEAALAAARSLEKVVEEEQRLKLSRKLKTSLKASAIAHEINQPLSRILLQSRLAASGGQTGKSALRSLIAEAETVVATIEKMKVLLRNVETCHERVNLYLVVSNSLRQLKQPLTLNRIEVERQGPQRGCSVHGDAVQLQLAVMNLLRNAIEAIAEGRSQSRKISIELKKGPDSVALAIGDSGPGWLGGSIEEALLKTSKSSGSGLGLYIVHTTMENHHGKLEVGRSQLGGAEFRMVFPSLHKGETAHRA